MSQKNKPQTSVKQQILSAAITALLSLGRIFSAPSPLAVAYIAFAPVRTLPISALTYLIYTLIFSNVYSVCILISVIITSVVRFKRKNISTNALVFIAAIALVAPLLFCRFALNVNISHWLTESIVLLGVSTLLQQKTDGTDIAKLTAYAIFILSLESVPIPIVGVGRIVGTFAILHIARIGDVGNSALFSSITALALLSAKPTDIYSAMFICAAGTLVTVISSKHILRQPLYFVCASLLFATVNISTSAEFLFVADVFVGASVFVFTFEGLDTKAFRLICSVFREKQLESKSCEKNKILSALDNISEEISQNTKLRIPQKPKNSTLAYTKVCMSCRKHSACYADKALDLTPLDTSTAVSNLPNECIRQNDILHAITEADSRYDYLDNRRHKCRQETAKTINMIETAKSLITDVCTEKKENQILSKELQKRLGNITSGKLTATVFLDNSATVTLFDSAYIPPEQLTMLLYKLTDCRYSEPSYVKSNSFTYICAYPRTSFTSSIYTCERSANDPAPSGDVFTSCKQAFTEYFILSDGMGTGERARHSAKQLSDMTASLLTSGASVETAVRFASASLKYADIDESFATLDIVEIDMNTAKATVYKCGATDSYIITDDIFTVKGGRYPIGIFDKVIMTSESFDLSKGGEIILSTDGAQVCYDGIKKSITKTDSSDELCQELISNYSVSNTECDDAFVAIIAIIGKF